MAFEDPRTPQSHSRRSHGSEYRVPPPTVVRACEPEDDYNPFESQPPSYRTRASFSRTQQINDDVYHRPSDYASPPFNNRSFLRPTPPMRMTSCGSGT